MGVWAARLICFLISFPFAVPFGVVAYQLSLKISKNRRYSIVGGWLTFSFVAAFLLAVITPVFMGAQEASKKTACLNNLKQLALGQIMYADDFDGRFPPPGTWAKAGMPHLSNPDVMHCPSATSPFSYAFNKNLALRKQTEIWSINSTILLFEADVSTPDATGGQELILKEPRDYHRVINVALADGSVSYSKNKLWTIPTSAGN